MLCKSFIALKLSRRGLGGDCSGYLHTEGRDYTYELLEHQFAGPELDSDRGGNTYVLKSRAVTRQHVTSDLALTSNFKGLPVQVVF